MLPASSKLRYEINRFFFFFKKFCFFLFFKRFKVFPFYLRFLVFFILLICCGFTLLNIKINTSIVCRHFQYLFCAIPVSFVGISSIVFKRSQYLFCAIFISLLNFYSLFSILSHIIER